jgi:hypothetical protein
LSSLEILSSVLLRIYAVAVSLTTTRCAQRVGLSSYTTPVDASQRSTGR